MKRGFSLIEVMSAAAIFGVGLAAIFAAFGSGGHQIEHQRHGINGIHLTEAKLEEILLWPASDPQLKIGQTFGPEWFDSEGRSAPTSSGCGTAITDPPPSKPECRYRVTWESTAAQIEKVRVVTATTAWNERGQRRSISFSTQRN